MLNPEIELIPNIRFDEGGKLHPDSAAAAALKGLTKSEISDKLIDLEGRYEFFQFAKAGKMRLRAKLAWWIAGPALRILRSQITLLALEYQRLASEDKAVTLQRHFGAEYDRLVTDIRGFRTFLKNHFEMEMEEAESLNTPLLDVAKRIMLHGSKPVRVPDPQNKEVWGG